MNEQELPHRLMDYLYGEMDARERKYFEEWLERHPEARAELQSLQDTRQWLDQWPDVTPAPRILALHSRASGAKWWWRAAAAAALIAGLWLANFQVHFQKGSLIISLGRPAPEQPAPVQGDITQTTLEDFEAILARQNADFEKQLATLDARWQEQFRQMDKDHDKTLASLRSDQRAQLDQLFQHYREEELLRLAAFSQDLQIGQQEELRLLLLDFWKDWQKTRETDMKAIGAEFTNVYQNVQRNQQETEALFVNILNRSGGGR